MHERDAVRIDSVGGNGTREGKQAGATTFSLRLWMLMIPLVLPVVGISAHYCEAFEQSGPVGSYLAAPLLMTSIFVYIGLIVVLKRRKI